MARATSSRTSSRRSRGGGGNRRSIDFSEVGRPFEADMEFGFEVKAAKWQEGDAGDYIAIEFKGIDEDYENSVIYHNASAAPAALPRFRVLLEALGLDIPEGPLDVDADELIGLQCMGATILEPGRDGYSPKVRINEFWPMEDNGKRDDKPTEKETTSRRGRSAGKAKEEIINLDDLSDEDIEKLGEEFDIEGRVSKIRSELKKADPTEVAEACKDLGIGEEKETTSRRGRSAGKDTDSGKGGRSSRGSGRSRRKQGISEDEVQKMTEEELEDTIEQHKLDVDLDDHSTLRKKKNAVIDALKEADLLEE